MTPPTLNDPITSQKIMKCINKLKNNKSPGSDMIINEYIKSTKEFVSTMWTHKCVKLICEVV